MVPRAARGGSASRIEWFEGAVGALGPRSFIVAACFCFLMCLESRHNRNFLRARRTSVFCGHGVIRDCLTAKRPQNSFEKYGGHMGSLSSTCNIPFWPWLLNFDAWRLAVVAFLESNGFSEIDVNCKKSSSFGLVRDWAAVACKHFWLSHAFAFFVDLRTFKLRNWDQKWDSGTYPLHEAAKQDVSCQLPTATSVTGRLYFFFWGSWLLEFGLVSQ